jgi:hypothetical protein
MAKAIRKFEVGQRVWKFDENHRVYTEPASGDIWGGGPIYSEHFIPYFVHAIEGLCYVIGPEAENRRWANSYGFAKAEREFLSDASKDDQIWAHDHRYKIARMVDRADVPTLRRVAEVVGYDPGV